MTSLIHRPISSVNRIGFRLALERLPGDRVQTGIIDIDGEEFTALRHQSRAGDAIRWLARELARHLGVQESDVDVNEWTDVSIRAMRRFRLIAHCRGKPPEATDGVAAFMAFKNGGHVEPKQLPAYIDI